MFSRSLARKIGSPCRFSYAILEDDSLGSDGLDDFATSYRLRVDSRMVAGQLALATGDLLRKLTTLLYSKPTSHIALLWNVCHIGDNGDEARGCRCLGDEDGRESCVRNGS